MCSRPVARLLSPLLALLALSSPVLPAAPASHPAALEDNWRHPTLTPSYYPVRPSACDYTSSYVQKPGLEHLAGYLHNATPALPMASCKIAQMSAVVNQLGDIALLDALLRPIPYAHPESYEVQEDACNIFRSLLRLLSKKAALNVDELMYPHVHVLK
ncbi:hypothetical protein C8T65DRAFT_692591 [Cerioporus squamosus]|nr:hypothetical protein C8T65DRAFT_692591 [Cerioporus squamosus]